MISVNKTAKPRYPIPDIRPAPIARNSAQISFAVPGTERKRTRLNAPATATPVPTFPLTPKYAKYQKAIRDAQVERAEKMLKSGKIKKERRNPNDPARFIGKTAVTEDGEIAKIENYLDTDKIENEALYDGLYAVTTDLLDDDVKDILKVSEGRWEIEECFRIIKTDFEARPVYLQDEIRIKAHFLICFLSLVIYRYLEKSLGNIYTCETILDKLKTMNFADVQEQGFMPLYTRDKLTDTLHSVCGFETDFQFITKSQMKTIQKKSKGRE